MPSRETILKRLVNVFSDKSPRVYSDEELLGVFRNPDLLGEKDKAEKLLMVGAIAERMSSSADFKRKMLEEIKSSGNKPTRKASLL
jgi:hypothetical protein